MFVFHYFGGCFYLSAGSLVNTEKVGQMCHGRGARCVQCGQMQGGQKEGLGGKG